MPFFDPGTLTLVVIIALLALAVVGMSAALAYSARAQRLPAATAYEDIYERLGATQTALMARQADLREVEQKIHERDRYAAEAAYLKEQVDKLQLEFANLAPARGEIEQVKAEAAAAAAEKATAEQDLDRLRKESERLSADLDPERIKRLTQELEDLRREIDSVNAELGPLRAERDAALRALTESAALESHVAALEIRKGELHAAAQMLRADLIAMEQAMEVARTTRDRLAAEAREAEKLAEDARKLVDETRLQKDKLAGDLVRLETDASSLEGVIFSLETQRDRIKKEIETMGGRTGGAGEGSAPLTEGERSELLKDLVAEPSCLSTPVLVRAAPRQEASALHEVGTYLSNSGLTFSRRTLKAFHTALKINDTAQITVLAGVSGTGKSLLPRRYAEAMGIHFLQVAVEPRWDSPQDLLGFYNYVEKKYRATELARLLAHLDPWSSHRLADGIPDRRNHMAIVLLDEMNLARVEYYFSEFLSRLEARPVWAQALTKERAKDAFIPVDIRGLDHPPMLFPAHNVLFVGTMNDDESTQSLSDKVLDRGNVMQFPAPSAFASPAQMQCEPASEAQRFSEWRNWVRSPAQIGEASQALVTDTISDLAQIMQTFGRPFGHRLNQSLRAYVANYPQEGNAGLDVREPLADQIEFRIMPKLRGVEIDTHRDAFDRLERLIRDRLQDSQLGDQVAQNRADQAAASGLFVWRGLSRGA
jgi:hypothetical protein